MIEGALWAFGVWAVVSLIVAGLTHIMFWLDDEKD